MASFRVLLLLALLLSGASSYAVNLPGPELDFLQRIQGQWQRHCYPSVDGETKVYRRDSLTVSFTQMQFKSVIYLDVSCSHPRTTYQSIHQFALTGAYTKQAGLMHFAINLIGSDQDSLFFDMPMKNIVAMEAGKLYFGRDYSGQSARGERLTKLNTRHPFLRH